MPKRQIHSPPPKATTGTPQDLAPRYRRINITIREDQYRLIAEHRLSISGLIRDLIDDRFAATKAVINPSKEGKALYDMLVSNFGLHDSDLEIYFLHALDSYLGKKLEDLESARGQIRELHQSEVYSVESDSD